MGSTGNDRIINTADDNTYAGIPGNIKFELSLRPSSNDRTFGT